MEHSGSGTSGVLRARQDVENEIEGRTLVDWLRQAAEEHGHLPALSQRAPEGTGAEWTTLTWAEYRRAALETAAALIAHGLRPTDVVALMLPNRPEHLVADMGAVHAGGVPLTVYATFAPEQIEFVARDCGAAVAVLEGAAELERWRPALERLPGLHTVVLLDAGAVPAEPDGTGTAFISWSQFRETGRSRYAADPGAVHERMAALRPEDDATLLYTSGTTGDPKGVPETHHQVLFQSTITLRASPLPVGGSSISYLPLAHIAERVLSVYLPIRVAGHLHFCPDSAQLSAYLGMVRPHSLFGVPRVWEKLQAGLSGALAAAPEERRQAVAEASETARAYLEAGQYGRTRGSELEERFADADERVLAPIRAMIGLDRCKHFITAAAPMPEDTLRFFTGLGVLLRDVYGMTENCGAVTANRSDAYRFNSVGRPSDGMEVAAAADGELLVRGPVNTAGYLNRPADSEALLDSDGWLHTGDIGWIDEDGFVFVLDRKKELIITAGGENIAPAAIENRLKEHALIGQALACGDGRPYPVALLTLDAEAAPAWAAARSIAETELSALAEHPAVLAEVERAVEAANARLARVQQIKRWRLLPVEWSVEGDELTPSLKLKRRVVQTRYADAISELYAD
ncbi:AMP-dependent synthetase/ligase [Streptomonospora litoralis]|uniref:Acyl-CoA synthetase n=1 Tax=Streptomonospora litoralis TaxID=2498135 RepID=A0A4P6Q0R3_9ACTN|nr:AMP-dependent synthetase/ligase [Streptomonospora litoralis]QBI54085.1 Long-chain-fatty-acid--CoA ligase FadD15 [Streptomonospora litoralis]